METRGEGKHVSPVSPARLARLSVNLSLEDAAKKARISTEYLRRVETYGAPFHLAERLSRVYGGVSISVFLPFKLSAEKRRKILSAKRVGKQSV